LLGIVITQENRSMSSAPNPARLTQYQAKLADLVALRDSYRAQHNDHKVKLLNRQIRAQAKWIRNAQSEVPSTPR
jgi:hypothetical protein